MVLWRLLANLKGAVCALLATFYTLLAVLLTAPVAVLKWLLRSAPAKRRCTRLSIAIFVCMTYAYRDTYQVIHRPRWDVKGFDGLRRDQSYLVICNHQAWSDIPIMAFPMLGRTPFFKFFLKQELLWVPLIGMACWALDFPFMQRSSREQLAKKPHLRGKDLETTRRLCKKLQDDKVTLVNYVEGTRFRPEKQRRQRAPYRYLLKPKSGGVAEVISGLGDQLGAVVDITIIYSHGPLSFWHFLCGRTEGVIVRAKQRPIPEALRSGHYQSAAAHRKAVQRWVTELWREKDALIAHYREKSG